MSQKPDKNKKQMKTGWLGAKGLALKNAIQMSDMIIRTSDPKDLINMWKYHIDREMKKGLGINMEFTYKNLLIMSKLASKLSKNKYGMLKKNVKIYVDSIHKELKEHRILYDLKFVKSNFK